MKYLKGINESMIDGCIPPSNKKSHQNPLGLNNYFLMTGQMYPDKDEYYKSVYDSCINIAMQVMQVSEKAFDMLDRLSVIMDKTVSERQDEFDTIVHNCKQRNFRPQYCAEIMFHTVFQGKLASMVERPFAMGGLKVD